jgi:hypothetical protein
MFGDTVEDLTQIGFGVDTVEFGGADQAVDCRRPLAA